MPVPEVKPIAGTPEEVAREDRRRASMTGAIDVHTHLWPAGFYKAILGWFDEHAWRIKYRGDAEGAVDLLRRSGVASNIALVYAHKPGIARMLNAFLGEVCRADKTVIGVGTVFPGETDARKIVREAIELHGLRGIKLHCHVQGVSIDDPRTIDVLRECELLGVPAVVHAGREPRSEGYPADPYEICGAAHVEKALQALPKLRLVIPHLGLDEIEAHFALLDRHENLFLDTAMACAEYFDQTRIDWLALARRSERIMYGTDFPITPFEQPDRELRILARRIEDDASFERLIRGTARAVWQP
jgi:predicted TIM-barrel fold metal-dependent hydrolase